MVSVFALSLQDQVEKYGVYVGLAAFFGLAVLTVLYFAQARELKRLREWAGRSPERAVELEERVLAQAGEARRVQAQPAKVPVAAPVPAAAAAVPAAAANASTTVSPPAKLMPQRTIVHPAAAAIPAAATAAAKAAPAQAAPATADGNGAEQGDGVSEDTVVGLPVTSGAKAAAPALPAAVPNGVTASPPATPPPAATPTPAPTAAPTPAPAPAAKPTPPPPPAKPAPAMPPVSRPVTAAPSRGSQTAIRRPGLESTLPPRRPGAGRDGGRSGRSTALLIGGVVAVLAALVFLGTQVLGGGGDDAPPAPNALPESAETPAASGSGASRPSVADSRKTTTVAVFNGTTTTGLAANILERLTGSGYAEGGRTGNAPDQSVADTTVRYAEGERRQAADAARLIGGAEVEAMDADDQALAGENAKLLVIVGADKAP